MPKALRQLQKERSILYFRGLAGGYCLWPHTSVNLERAYQDAGRAVPTPRRVGPLIRDDLETRPLVARRHYIETGNLRHFDVRYVAVEELASSTIETDGSADGRILIALCETEEERREALAVAGSAAVKGRDDLLIAVPSPLQGLAKVLHEVLRWEWVSENVPELNNDSYAAEEVARQLEAARLVLDRHLRNYIGLRQLGDAMELAWFYQGKRLEVTSGRDLLSKLSSICDRLYNHAPLIRNELVNRTTLSSAASAARMRLIEKLLEKGSEPLLGMDEKGTPPEMSMYLSVLKRAGLHRKSGKAWALAVPSESQDPCRVRPVLSRIADILEQAPDGRVRVNALFDKLRLPPYGVREGLAPLFLAVFAAIQERDVAFYADGSFLRNVTGYEFQRLIKTPETFEVQLCRVTGLRAVVFERLSRLLGPEPTGRKKADILDVVKPLCVFAAQLPAYTHRTGSLSDDARCVRDALLSAEDPAKLLFSSLPAACGLAPFLPDEAASASRVRQFVDRLKSTMDELRGAYPSLLERIKGDLLAAFDRPGTWEEAREAIADTADRLLVAVNETRLKSFCMRLADRRLGDQEWLESIASLLCAKPASKWADIDVRRFADELNQLAHQFKRVESTSFTPRAKGGEVQVAMRVAITSRDGSEVERVVYLDPSEETRVAELEAKFDELLGDGGRLGIVAATRAIWGRLRSSEDDGRTRRRS